MTTPGRYASSDNSFARSTGNAAARGVMLIAVAVLIGVVLLSKGFDGSSSAADVPTSPTTSADPGTTAPPDDSTDAPATTTDAGETPGTTAAVVVPAVTRPAGEVKVVVANGTGVSGAAGAAKDELTAVGYVAEAKNAVTVPTELSAVYYIDGYEEEAKAVASTMGGTAALLRVAPADPAALIKTSTDLTGFHIFVILGVDNAIS